MKKIIAVLAVLASVSSAQAAEKMFDVGALVGYGTASISGTSYSGFTWGATVNYNFMPEWSAGIYFSDTKKSDTIFGVDTSTTFMPIMLQVNWMPASAQGFHIGPRLGITSAKTDVAGTSTSNSDFTVGAQAGYDFFFTPDWSIGIDANWNYVLNSTTKFSLFNFVAPIKYHF